MSRTFLPREAWAAFRELPLTEEEFARIARNTAPYLRQQDLRQGRLPPVQRWSGSG